MTNRVLLRNVTEEDLPSFFDHQLDAEANWMAAFTAKDPTDRAAFTAHWHKILADEGIIIKTILYESEVAGHVLCHSWFGEPEVSYWLGKDYWGKGLATQALAAFLNEVQTRPLYARVAKDNIASRRVLAKCGFVVTGEERGFSNARGVEVEEVFMVVG